VPDDAYFDGLVAKTAVDTLRKIGPRKRSFFLAVGFWKPHTPFNAPKKYWDFYERESIPLPEHLEPPKNVPNIALTEYRFDGARYCKLLREMHHGHLAAISYLDSQVGRVLHELDALGLYESTVIVFWSDHGLHIGEHGLRRKTTAFELDARVPLIISTPQYQGGQRSSALVELLDIYPTLAELCGLKAPEGLEGVSLVPLLENPNGKVKSVALTETPRPAYLRGKSPEVMGYSLRTDRYRYTEWRDFETSGVQARELYDHKMDPLETVNIAGQAEQKATVAKLAKQLDQTISSVEGTPQPSEASTGRH